MEEIKRLLIALQTIEEHQVSTPADWQPGEDVIVNVPKDSQELKEKDDKIEAGDIYCLDWYFCFKKL
jgi:peroxiredoxin (alkyl hydroperoxide reductase subunit C)